MDSPGPPGPAGQEQSPHQSLRKDVGRAERRPSRRSWKSKFLPGKHLGDLVVEAQHVSKGYGDRLLIEDLSFRLPPGGIVGIIGPNGAGKTTLFRMIMGLEQPDTGVACASADTVELGYVDQNRDALDPKKTDLRGDLRRPRHAGDGRAAR